MNRIFRYAFPAVLFCLAFTPAAMAGINDDLYEAVTHSDTQNVKDLLAQGADPNSSWKNPFGEVWTALHVAAQNDNAEIAGLLLDKGADANAKSLQSKQTPLMTAADYGSKKVAQLLLDRGADPNAKDDNGTTPLLFAIDPNNWNGAVDAEAETEIVRALIAKGADPGVTKNGWTPLMYAAARNKPEIVKLLVAKGADVNISKDGNSALSLAENNGYADIVTILKAAGAK
jgi:ankyrin repeat protein